MPWTLDVEHALAPGLTVRRHRLHNGLTLISMPDDAAPVVSYQSWFGVGSRHEEPGKTGMAHLFEHLMFNQTASLAAGEFDRRIEQTGGDSNAATWVDWTYYRDTVPARDLALCVGLEADRMVNLVLEDGPLEAEREVVSNERLERVDDDVDGFLDEELYRLAFTHHPYRSPTIGWMADIRALAKPDVIRFYRTFYAPNNATVVVVGQFEEAALLDLIEERYGALEAAVLPGEASAPEPIQDGERRATFVKPTAAARLHIGWRAAGQGEADWAALSVAAALLAAGSSSRLHRRLVIERELCSGVGCDVSPFRDPGLFRLSLNLTRGSTIEAVEAEVDSAIAELVAGRISDRELTKVKNIVETDFWAELDTCDGRAEAFGHYQTVLGDFRMMFEVAARLGRVTASDVAAAATRYLGRATRCLLIVLPDEGDGPDAEDEGDGDGVEADVMSDVPLYLETASATPMVWFVAALRGGAGLDPVGLEGVTRHAAELARRGAGALDRAALDAEIDELGASLEVDVDRDSVSLSGMALVRNLPRLLELAAAVLGQPRLDPQEHEQLLRETRHELDDLRDDDSSLADRFFNLRCAPGHPYGRTTLGSEATLGAIDLAAAHRQRTLVWSRDRLRIGFAGAIEEPAARIAADRLADAVGHPGAPPLPELAAVASPPGLRIYVVDKPARSQCQMLFGHTGPRYGTDDFTALLPLETAFGGMFTSRLMQEIGVKRGWSYGAGCRFHRAALGHWFRIHLAPTAEVTPDALRLVLDLYADLCAKGLDDDEITFAKGYLTGSLALGRQTARQRMRQRLQHDLLGLPASYLPTLGERIAGISRAEVAAAATRWLRPADLCVVVVATAAQEVPRLEAAGFAVTEVLPYDSY